MKEREKRDRKGKERKRKEGKLSTTNATNINMGPKTGIRCDRP